MAWFVYIKTDILDSVDKETINLRNSSGYIAKKHIKTSGLNTEAVFSSYPPLMDHTSEGVGTVRPNCASDLQFPISSASYLNSRRFKLELMQVKVSNYDSTYAHVSVHLCSKNWFRH